MQPSSEHVIIYGIQFHTDNGTTAANFAGGQCVWQKGFTTGNNPIFTPTTAAQPATTAGVVYLRDVWGGDWDSDLITQSRGTLYLNVPVIWAGQTSLEVTVATQDGSAFPSNYNIRCELMGIGLI